MGYRERCGRQHLVHREHGDSVGRLNFAPGAVTDPATQIGASDATLAGTVTPRSQATTYSFDWGLTAAYGSSTATDSAGSGASAQSVTAVISGLAPATTYHFRLVASNAAGTAQGADRTFVTSAAPPAATTVLPAPFALPATLAPVVAPSLPPATRPVLGKSATVAAASGEILVQLPGSGSISHSRPLRRCPSGRRSTPRAARSS